MPYIFAVMCMMNRYIREREGSWMQQWQRRRLWRPRSRIQRKSPLSKRTRRTSDRGLAFHPVLDVHSFPSSQRAFPLHRKTIDANGWEPSWLKEHVGSRVSEINYAKIRSPAYLAPNLWIWTLSNICSKIALLTAGRGNDRARGCKLEV